MKSLSAGLGYKCMYVARGIAYKIYTTLERGREVGWLSYSFKGKVVPSYEERGVLFAFTHRSHPEHYGGF